MSSNKKKQKKPKKEEHKATDMETLEKDKGYSERELEEDFG